MRFRLKYFCFALNISFGLVISCSVGADTVGVDDFFMSCFTACVRPKLDIVSFDITSHPHQYPRTSNLPIRLEHTSHPAVSTAPHIRFRWSLTLPNLFFSEDVKVPSGTETSHNGFCLMAKSSRHFGRLLSCATLGFRGTVARTKRNRIGSGDVQGLCSYAQALIPVLDTAPSGFPSHASMRDALQAVRKTHEVFGQISDAQLWVAANTASVGGLCASTCAISPRRVP